MEKNVLYISSEPGLGGASQSLCDMLNDIKQYIHPIVVIPFSGDLENRLKQMQIKCYCVEVSRGIGEIGQHTLKDEETDFVLNYKAALKIKQIIEKEKIDLVHINSSVCNAGAMGAVISGIPYVWHFREALEEHSGREFWDIDFKQLLFARADKLIAISQCVQKIYFDRYHLDSRTIYNGIDSGRYFQHIQKKEENHSFLVAGCITEAKGQLDVVKAARIIKGKGINDIKIHIVGSSTTRFTWFLERYAKKHGLENNIYLYDFMSDLSDLRRQCTYAIVPSKFEALGRVTAEAMMAGNIVIGANTGGTLEIIGEDKKRGYVYTQGNVESLAASMLEAINEKSDKKDRMRKDAQEFAVSKFDIKKYTLEVYGVYREIWGKEKTKDTDFIRYLEERYGCCADITDYGKQAEDERHLSSKTVKIEKAEKKLADKETAINEFLHFMKIKSVAIYGMGRLGCKLYDILDKLQITISYVIDRYPYCLNEIVEVFAPDDRLPMTDAIIITAMDDGNEIKEKYNKKYEGVAVFNITELIEKLDDL